VPELPEVETVRRMLERQVLGRRIRALRRSGAALRGERPDPRLPRRVRGRAVEAVRRHGKYLLIDLEGGLSLLSHLGMSGRWLFVADRRDRAPAHVHARIEFEDGSALWYEDPRRFGLLRGVATAEAHADAALAILGPDPVASRFTGEDLARLGRGARVSAKTFLLDQRRLAGVGNIYASEILHRAGVHPARLATSLSSTEWQRIARELEAVLAEAIARMGTTFSMYRTLWNEPGAYGDQLRVYDRAGEPCRTCGAPIRRVVQQQRSTFYCPSCQARRPLRAAPKPRSTRASTIDASRSRRARLPRR
jgi:formamidopyrimidine-DNA glycosylase